MARVSSCCFSAAFGFVLLGCGAKEPAPSKVPVAPPVVPTRVEPLCKVLQPQFDRVTEQFNLGGKLLCSDVPGVVTLGQFGTSDRLDRHLLACVDESSQFSRQILVEPAAVSGIEYSTSATVSSNGTVGLAVIAPWLPSVKASKNAGESLRMKLTVTDAAWETLPDLGRIFEGQNHAYDCLPALCQENSTIAYKILKGRVQVELTAEKTDAFVNGVSLLASTAEFSVDKQASSGSSVTLGSNERVILGVVAKMPRAELNDASQCDGCGARGQACCSNSPACDENLSCLDGTCRPKGFPGALCDNSRCENASVCVHGICRLGCGSEGLICCDKESCSDGNRCQRGLPARHDVTILDEIVERSGGFFGTDVDVELGNALCGENRLRSRFATTKIQGDSAHCDQAAWIAPIDANDCRVKMHVHVSPFSRIRCRVQVLVSEPDPRVPVPQALCVKTK
jgi:hypothetical protein